MNELSTRWEKFDVVLEGHAQMLAEQVNVMRANVESRLTAFRLEVDKFAARWHQMKPSRDLMETGSGEEFKKALALVKEKKGEFEALQKERESTERDCEHFGLSTSSAVGEPETPAAATLRELRAAFAALEKELASFEDMWGVYEEWAGAEGLEKFAKEDWISFRSRYFGFEEFLLKWLERIRKLGQLNGITMRILKDAERYKVRVS